MLSALKGTKRQEEKGNGISMDSATAKQCSLRPIIPSEKNDGRKTKTKGKRQGHLMD
jgi:hypothetical protein